MDLRPVVEASKRGIAVGFERKAAGQRGIFGRRITGNRTAEPEQLLGVQVLRHSRGIRPAVHQLVIYRPQPGGARVPWNADLQRSGAKRKYRQRGPRKVPGYVD